jgi:uncharacterized protein YegP (UPF0339 family)
MGSWYELNKSKDNQFRFVLKAANSEILLTSELYRTKASAENGIDSVRANCETEARYERQRSRNGKWYFNLRAANQQIIGTSEMYESERARDAGITSVMANGTAEVVKELKELKEVA